MNAQVQIEYADLKRMETKIASLEALLADTQAALEQARLGGTDSEVRRLATAFGYALDIVRFAIAELHPIAYRGWPYESLRKLGELAASLPGVDASFREVAQGDWRIRANEMEKWEKARAEGREHDLLAEENAARTPGPDHPVFSSGIPSRD